MTITGPPFCPAEGHRPGRSRRWPGAAGWRLERQGHGCALEYGQPADRWRPRSTPAGSHCRQHTVRPCRRATRELAAIGGPRYDKPARRQRPKRRAFSPARWAWKLFANPAASVKNHPGSAGASSLKAEVIGGRWIGWVVREPPVHLLRHTQAPNPRRLARLRAFKHDGLQSGFRNRPDRQGLVQLASERGGRL